MDVLLLNDFARVNGGSAAVCLAEAEALAADGHRVRLFAGNGPVAERLSTAGVEVHCLDQPTILDDPDRAGAALRGLWNREAARALAALLRDDPPDILHLHSWSKVLSSSVVPVALDSGCPVFVTLHDYFHACPNGGFYDYRAGQICTRRPMSIACMAAQCDSRSYAHKLWRLVRQGVQNGPGAFRDRRLTYLCVSDFSRRLLAPGFPSGARVETLFNPVTAPDTGPADVAANDAILSIGRLSPEKGHVLLAEAAAPLDRPLIFIGDGDDAVRDRVGETCPRAQFAGWLPPETVAARLRSARAVVLPSLLAETQGLCVWEAAAQGVPAIVGDASAATDFVENGVTGLTFRMGDADDLRRVLRCLGDDALVARLGRAAYDRFWAQDVTPAAHARALSALYATALEYRRPTGGPPCSP